MKKGIIKFFIWVVLFAGLGGTVFFFGWMQFAVPVGHHGVMISKSGGYYSKPIAPGDFLWRWERLIPTNSKVFIFNLAPVQIDYAVQGVLPSSDNLFKITDIKPDFSWKCGVVLSACLNPEYLVSTVKNTGIKTQSELDDYIKLKLTEAVQKTVNKVILQFLKNPERERVDFQYGEFQARVNNELQKKLQTEILINSVQLSKEFLMPDMVLYNTLMQTYVNYEKKKAEELSEIVIGEAKKSALSKLRMDDLKQWGELLKEYPLLIDFLAVARNDASEALKALKDLRSNIVQGNSPNGNSN